MKNKLLLFIFWINIIVVPEEIVLKVVNQDFPPFMSRDLSGGGPAIQLFYDLVKGSGISFDLNWATNERAYWMIKTGQADISFGWLVSDKRIKEVKFSDPIEFDGYSILYKKGSSFNWNSIEDFYGLRVGLQKGVIAYGEEFLEAEATGKIITERVADMEQNIRKLLSGRLDIVIGSDMMLMYLIDKDFSNQKDQLAFHEKKLPSALYCIIFRNDISPEIIGIFNDAIKILKKSERIHKDLGFD